MTSGGVLVLGGPWLGDGSRADLKLNARAGNSSSDQRQVVATWANRLSPWIRGVARLRARGDESLQADLEQVAYLRLVEIDPSRLTIADERWLMRRLAYAMKLAAIDERRHLRPVEDRQRLEELSTEAVAAALADAPVSTLEARRFRKNRRERLARKRAALSKAAVRG